MSPQEYKDLATANGYDLGNKTDVELLTDYAFHKAACVGMEMEVCCWSFDGPQGFANFQPAHHSRFFMATDGLENGMKEEQIWQLVGNGALKVSDARDENGRIKGDIGSLASASIQVK